MSTLAPLLTAIVRLKNQHKHTHTHTNVTLNIRVYMTSYMWDAPVFLNTEVPDVLG